MDSFALHYFGKAPNSGWDIYSLAMESPEPFPDALALPSPKFVCLLSWNANSVSVETIGTLAESLLKAGCVYFCCWGQDCERVHDVIDEVVVGDGSTNVAWLNIMTTWHAKDSLPEAVDFTLDCACPDDIYINDCSAAVAIVIGNEFEAASMELALAAKLVQPPSNPPFQGTRRQAARP
jgi:hypothetical protein